MIDPIAKAYLRVIEEETSSGVVDSTKTQVNKVFGDAESEKKLMRQHQNRQQKKLKKK